MKTGKLSTMTSLCCGGKISKASLRMDALGDIDEVIAVLGIIRASVKNNNLKKRLYYLQQKLMVEASEIATLNKNARKLKNRISPEDVFFLEEEIKLLKLKGNSPSCFICPGNNLTCAYLHWARAVIRRTERKIVKLFEQNEILNKSLLIWINKLSQYVFFMAQRKNK